MELPSAAFEDSILIVAHPDDEILWFSSILDHVKTIVICFQDDPSNEELGIARRKSLLDHAYHDRIVSLELEEVRSFNKSGWPEPEPTEYGLRLSTIPGLDRPYREVASVLESRLREHVDGRKNVFTHSPWGEYGHEDHVQVSKVATRLAMAAGADIWFSNYVSSKSIASMNQHIDGFERPYFSMPVDAASARKVADVYYQHGAWTWFDDYRWFDSECFVQGPLEPAANETGCLFPVNYIRLPHGTDQKKKADSDGGKRYRRLPGRVLRRLKGGA